jgi:hypothetical protein
MGTPNPFASCDKPNLPGEAKIEVYDDVQKLSSPDPNGDRIEFRMWPLTGIFSPDDLRTVYFRELDAPMPEGATFCCQVEIDDEQWAIYLSPHIKGGK